MHAPTTVAYCTRTTAILQTRGVARMPAAKVVAARPMGVCQFGLKCSVIRMVSSLWAASSDCYLSSISIYCEGIHDSEEVCALHVAAYRYTVRGLGARWYTQRTALVTVPLPPERPNTAAAPAPAYIHEPHAHASTRTRR